MKKGIRLFYYRIKTNIFFSRKALFKRFVLYTPREKESQIMPFLGIKGKYLQDKTAAKKYFPLRRFLFF